MTLILWSGMLGGAETSTGALARAMRTQGVDARILFVTQGQPLSAWLDSASVPHASLGLRRGSEVLRHPRRLAQLATRQGSVAVSMSAGYLAGALRLGGYRGPIVAVEHGALLHLDQLPRRWQIVRTLDRRSGVWACAAEVAVSEYTLARLRRSPHPSRLDVIPNGVDLRRYSPDTATARTSDEPVIACAARLIPGKGIDNVIRALEHPALRRARLTVAGSGPAQLALERLAQSLGVSTRVDFIGNSADMAAYWRSCDIAVVPSDTLVESFGMAAVEAMATGKPLVASSSGGLPETVGGADCGIVYEAGDVAALTEALAAYVADADLRRRHGENGRRRCEEHFDINVVASRYLALCRDVLEERNGLSHVGCR